MNNPTETIIGICDALHEGSELQPGDDLTPLAQKVYRIVQADVELDVQKAVGSILRMFDGSDEYTDTATEEMIRDWAKTRGVKVDDHHGTDPLAPLDAKADPSGSPRFTIRVKPNTIKSNDSIVYGTPTVMLVDQDGAEVARLGGVGGVDISTSTDTFAEVTVHFRQFEVERMETLVRQVPEVEE